jgi:hypothetical protein
MRRSGDATLRQSFVAVQKFVALNYMNHFGSLHLISISNGAAPFQTQKVYDMVRLRVTREQNEPLSILGGLCTQRCSSF